MSHEEESEAFDVAGQAQEDETAMQVDADVREWRSSHFDLVFAILNRESPRLRNHSLDKDRRKRELEKDSATSRWSTRDHNITSCEGSADSQGGQGDPDGQQGGHICDIRRDSQCNTNIWLLMIDYSWSCPVWCRSHRNTSSRG